MTSLEEKISYAFKNSELLTQALTHKSYHNENNKNSPGHNERLEFLGDAVIDLILSELLFKLHPEMNEGELSKVRASLVNEHILSEIALSLDLDKHMKLGKGEMQTGGPTKPRLLASSFEALAGALYLDGELEKSLDFIKFTFKEKLKEIDMENHFATDYKTRLQEKAQEKFKKTPMYKLSKEEGPDHSKSFYVELYLGEKLISSGVGKSKKQAEQNAAKEALEVL